MAHSLTYAARGRAEKLVRLALVFALSLRGRRLSARNLGPASSVEADHPHCMIIITPFSPAIIGSLGISVVNFLLIFGLLGFFVLDSIFHGYF